MTRRVLAGAGPSADPTDSQLARGRAEGFVWLDVASPGADDLRMLREVFGVEPELLEPPRPAPRPRLHEAEGYLLVTLVGAAGGNPDGALAEITCLAGPGWAVTLHDGPGPPPGRQARPPSSAGDVLGAVAEAAVTGLVDLAGRLADLVEALEQHDERGDLAAARRRVTPLRRVVLPQRDVLDRLEDAVEPLGADEALLRRLRNAAERMGQVGHEVEAIREAVHDIASDRANDVMKRLTAIAGIFLPLAFLTGFFGQNFAWMVDHVGGVGWFVALGIGLPVVTAAALFAAFRRRDWL